MEISIIENNKVVYSKDFSGYVKKLKNKKPNEKKMRAMENKFLNLVKKDKMVEYFYKIAIGTGTYVLASSPMFTYADSLTNVTDKLKTITSPVIELLAGLGYPVTYGMLITGAIMIIMGKKSKGLDIIKWACIGYIGLQFVPFLLGLLDTIGRELRYSL